MLTRNVSRLYDLCDRDGLVGGGGGGGAAQCAGGHAAGARYAPRAQVQLCSACLWGLCAPRAWPRRHRYLHVMWCT